MNSHELTLTLERHLTAVEVPPADLAAVRRRGRAAARRRAARFSATVAAVSLAVVGTAGWLLTDPWDQPRTQQFTSDGVADVDQGLRAYGSGTGGVVMGGATFDASLDSLDTAATATRAGVLFLEQNGTPRLFAPDGVVTDLGEPSTGAPDDFHPTAKADATGPLVAWTTVREGTVDVVLYDLDAQQVVASTPAPCSSPGDAGGAAGGAAGCAGFLLEGLDSGTVFARSARGSFAIDVEAGTTSRLGGKDVRIADARNHVVLYDQRGTAPRLPDESWRAVPGAIDSQLTFDGEHVLGWSSTLEPTRPGGDPIVLDKGPADGKGYGFWNVDTDGSILVITPQKDQGRRLGVYDCAVPSGVCKKIDTMVAESGDPVFIGNDM